MWQILTLAILLALMVALQQFDLALPESPFDPKSVAASGFILLAAFTTGELFKRFNIPALLGYIAAGIVFGPNFISVAFDLTQAANPQLAHDIFGPSPQGVFSRKVIEDLALINVLTVGVIGTMGGGELKISDIRDSWRSILLLIAFITVTAIPLTFGAVFGMAQLPVDLVGFLAEAPRPDQIAGALMLGILAIAMSPAATLAIIQETRARGSFTSLVLGVVVVADLALVALFLVGFSLSKLLVSPEGFSAAALAAALPGIGAEFGFALIIGAATGVAFIAYIRYVEREMLLFTVAIIFTTSFLCKIAHAETLLAFLTAGFIVQNFSRHGHDLIHALEKISLPVFIIYFMTQAAQLDLNGVAAYLPLTLILATARAGAFWGSAKLTSRLIPNDPSKDNLLWMTFLSRGGVDLVLAGLVASAVYENGAPIFTWGADFQTVIMSTVVVHIVLGPPLLKYALGKAGETDDARAPSSASTSGETSSPKPTRVVAEFPKPDFPDRYLNARLYELRDALIDLHTDLIARPFERRGDDLASSLRDARLEVDASLDRLDELLSTAQSFESDAALARAVEKLHNQSRKRLQPFVQVWEQVDPIAFGPDHADDLIFAVSRLEDFENHCIVELEPQLFDVDAASTRYGRLVRRARRIQRVVAGKGRRTIPLGRLWRYYIELTVPRYLAQAAQDSAPEHEAFWFELGNHLRNLDSTFRLTRHILEEHESLDPHDDSHDDHDHDHGHGHGHDDHDHGLSTLLDIARERASSDAPRYESARAFFVEARARLDLHGTTLSSSLSSAVETSSLNYSWSLQQAFSAFLDAATLAGTLELTGFAYRPSTQFDSARQATEHLRAHLERESRVVSSYIGWLVLDHQLVIFTHWFDVYRQRISDTMHGLFHDQCMRQLERLEQRCLEGADVLAHEDIDPSTPEHEIAWTKWMRRELHPASRGARRALDRALISFGQGVTSRRLIDTLEYRVASFSEQLTLSLANPETHHPRSGAPATLDVRARQWFSNRLVNEIALHYIEFNERTERLVRRNLVGLDSIDQILEYNIHTAQRDTDAGLDPDHANTVASGALERAAKLVAQLTDDLSTEIAEIEAWLIEETTSIARASVNPFRERRLADIQPLLQRHAHPDDVQNASILARSASSIKRTARSLYDTISPVYDELLEDLRHILVDERRIQRRSHVRQLLEVDHAHDPDSIPTIYRRLFNPVPLDLPEFYVERPELERDCLDAIAQWGLGHPGSILLFGDRGIGKRTLIHNLVPIRIYDLAPVFQDTPIQTLRLSEETSSEADLCAQLSPLVPNDSPGSFEELTRALNSSERRQIVIVENATKAFNRTADGLELCRDFLTTIGRTSRRTLWILIMDTPAATLLDTTLDLFDYFTHVFELEPLLDEQIERMITNRHRVSGYDIDFDPPPVRILHRMRHPLSATDALRNPRDDFFRRLTLASQGNPLFALLLWLRSVHIDPEDDALLRVEHIHDDRLDVSLTDGLTLDKLLILSLVLQHGSLTSGQLAEILQRPQRDTDIDLSHLARLGFVEVMVGTSSTYRLRNLAAPKTTTELRDRNLV